VWASIRNNLPPQIHVIGTAVFVTAVGLVAISTFIQGRSTAKLVAPLHGLDRKQTSAAQAREDG
jgi:hypothetical protein